MVTCVFCYQPGLRETLSLREKGILGTHYFCLLLLNCCCGSQEILQDAIKKDKDSLTTEASGTPEAGRKMAACRPAPRESSKSRAAGVSGRGVVGQRTPATEAAKPLCPAWVPPSTH